MKILVTGGAGFIGSAVIRYLLSHTPHRVVNVDKLTYAGNLTSLADVEQHPHYAFEHVDIADHVALTRVFSLHQPDAVMHLAAESHVDRSIDGPEAFIETNIVGTYTLLEVSRAYWFALDVVRQQAFRFHHVSTDEVYGDLASDETKGNAPFTELARYAPSSPYSASKAASDHLVRAWHRTYGFPIVISNCSNNYGPYQNPEKLIPLMITRALSGQSLPLYGDGLQVRDWLYVDDHVRALYAVLTQGKVGETYNIGGGQEKTNRDVVSTICQLLEELAPSKPQGVQYYADLITYVVDRPGHDRRYAIDASKITQTLGWTPSESFESGMRKTVEWYLNCL